MKHTPGPWKAVETEDGDYEIVAIEKKPTIGKIIIAEHVAQGVNDGEEDALLIAAAPDLLEVLEEINNRYSSLMTEKMKNKMRSAINKARGL